MSTLGMPMQVAYAQTDGSKPWLNKNLSAEERADLLINAMTLDQKIQQIAVSRFNENDKGETIVIERSGTNAYQSGEFPP